MIAIVLTEAEARDPALVASMAAILMVLFGCGIGVLVETIVEWWRKRR